MIRPALIIMVMTMASPATTENDPQAGPMAHRELTQLFANVSTSGNRSHAMREPTRNRPRSQMAEANYQIAIRAGERIGVPAAVTAFHVARESGGRANARNPASTATGLLQVIRGTHAAIIGRPLTLTEHVRLASDPAHNAAVGAAHIRACMDAMPGAGPADLWRRCHVAGHAAVGTRVEMAARYYRPDASGWLERGSVAAPWARGEGA